MDEYINNIAIVTQQAAESRSTAPVDPDEVWRQTVSEPDAKNRIYDLGGFLVSTLRTSESEERQKALHDELSRRPKLRDPDVEALKQQMREKLRLMQEAQRQMGVTGEHMRAGASFIGGGGSSSAVATQDLPSPPPAPQEDNDEDYVDP
ncbi:hypothetical protein PIB30_006935 [Stylosanthes scabra]|uniref:Uncharacterized protein n=1 Tax=Stylosanthes scabra TaxID=79078 RepID=A0ABU6X1V5_9FABA|nr:hypothetical protein [Stylosanthes scabra]